MKGKKIRDLNLRFLREGERKTALTFRVGVCKEFEENDLIKYPVPILTEWPQILQNCFSTKDIT
jgi:hypothetical protein